MEVWKFIQKKLEASVKVLVLWVLDSEGSSPGRQGFKMAVALDGSFEGTIGGGIMEHKLVEKAKVVLVNEAKDVVLVRQFHDKKHVRDQSGMICSGSQLIAFVPVDDLPLVSKLIEDDYAAQTVKNGIFKNALMNSNNVEQSLLHLTNDGLKLLAASSQKPGLVYKSDEDWDYHEKVDQRPVIHIIGGGHVGLALSELMHFLGFFIKVYDNRQDLNTMANNKFADEQIMVDYESIGDIINDDPDAYVAIMTFGYREDKIVFKQLFDKKFFYIGMLGSKSKIETITIELAAEGIQSSDYAHCHVPIGINIFSKTTKEIAVSIAAEIIKEKNKALPGGRSEKA